jgi:hypothetical protein
MRLPRLIIRVTPFFEPSCRLSGDPILGFGLGLEPSDVLLLAAWMGGDHIPFVPQLERLRDGRRFPIQDCATPSRARLDTPKALIGYAEMPVPHPDQGCHRRRRLRWSKDIRADYVSVAEAVRPVICHSGQRGETNHIVILVVTLRDVDFGASATPIVFRFPLHRW